MWWTKFFKSTFTIFFSFSKTIFYDPGHVGDFGNNVVAEKMHEKIMPIIIRDISAEK